MNSSLTPRMPIHERGAFASNRAASSIYLYDSSRLCLLADCNLLPRFEGRPR